GRHEEAIISYNKAIEINPDFYQAWHARGGALHNLMQYEEALASYDKALEIKPDYHYAWIGRGNAVFNLIAGNKNFRSRFILPVITTYPDLALIFKNPYLNEVGYVGLFASYKEGLKHCPQETEGWGRLHLAIGQVHYLRGCKDEKPLSHWRKAFNSYNIAITTLTEKAYPEAHLEVLQNLIRCFLALEQINEATELQRRGSDILQKLLKDTKSTAKQKQLALKFVSFQQITVDLAVQSGNSIQALELAEQGKNACLSWLLEGWSEEIFSPTWQDIQQLLNPTTAIIYWHLSPAALHTFILKYDSPTPIVLTQSELFSPSQRLQEFEDWVTNWNQQYNDYRGKGKDEVGKNNHPWRNDIQTNLNQLKNILDIDTIKQQLSGINQLILVPHRDLHRFPLHVLFNADEEKSKFIINYLPSAKLGVTNTLTRSDYNNKLLIVEVSPPQDDEHLFDATLEAEIISQMFEYRQRIQEEEATKEELEAALENGYEIFHFAGHANYNFSEPKNSQLALAKEDKLTLQEIYQKNLTTYKLVSLSACETAITGNQTITTEYVGLVSGFLSRGVSQVVSTLWTVKSAASSLIMIEFYRRRQQPNKSDCQALTEATTWLRNLTAGELQKWYKELQNQIPPEKLTGGINGLLKGEIRKISKEKPDKILYNDIYYWGAFTITGKPLSS
ncbi:MAG: CHAT domain-containing protein, partial [Sphaerospermopsis kisseleviana]